MDNKSLNVKWSMRDRQTVNQKHFEARCGQRQGYCKWYVIWVIKPFKMADKLPRPSKKKKKQDDISVRSMYTL